MRSVVTGASGHLGANLVRLLREQGGTVRALVHKQSAALAGLDGVEQVPANLFDPESLRAAFKGADRVYHLAGKISTFGDPDGSVRRTNVEGASHAASAALHAKVERFLHCSSAHAYDFAASTPGSLDESFPLVAEDSGAAAYDRSKAQSERVVHGLIAAGLDAVIVNPTGVIGPEDFGPSRMGDVFLELKARTLPSLVNGGFDFVDARDVAQGMVAAMERGSCGESYLLGNRTASVVELASMAQEVTGQAPPSFTCPRWLAMGTAPFIEAFARVTGRQPMYTRESLTTLARGRDVSSDKARRVLGYRTRPLEDSVRDAYASFAARGC